jgi:pSer/pThr/pTyr-binding forkhead associated (FHA) protein
MMGTAPAHTMRPADEEPAAAAPAPAEYFLRDGEHLHTLQVGVNSIGRLQDNNVVILDEHVSRRHCAIVIHRDGRAEVHDVASKNGTILNGKKIAGPTRIHPGDQITMCSRSIVFLAGPRTATAG